MLIGATIVCNYAQASLRASSDAGTGQASPFNWEIDEAHRRISKASNVTRRDKRISLVQFREGKTHGTWVGIACITYPQKEVYYTYAYKTIILTAISIV